MLLYCEQHTVYEGHAKEGVEVVALTGFQANTEYFIAVVANTTQKEDSTILYSNAISYNFTTRGTLIQMLLYTDFYS